MDIDETGFGINRNIVECKVKSGDLCIDILFSINRNIVECKVLMMLIINLPFAY